MHWTYYDAAGKPVPEKAATFRCREVSVLHRAVRPRRLAMALSSITMSTPLISRTAQDLQVLQQDEGVVQGACLENEGPRAMTKPSLPKTS